jgi:predicted permease
MSIFWWRKRAALDEEVRTHMQMAERERIERGEDPARAREAARREFGNPELVRESTRDAWGWRWLENFFQDVRFGARMLRKNPGFTIVAVLTLALGIGANTAIFSWIHTVLLEPLPGVSAPDRVVALETLTPDSDWVPTSYLDFRDLRDNSKLVESMSIAKPLGLAVGEPGSVEQVWGEGVSGNFFDLLRVKPEVGRFFSTAEVDHEQNAHPLAIISHSYWTTHYQEDSRAVGETVRINHVPYTIIGVAPEGFHGSMPGLDFDIWVPATMYGQLSSTGDHTLRDRKWRTFRVLARLAPGTTIEQARTEVQAIATRMATADADTNEGMSATLLPLWKSHYGIQDSLVGPLSILMAAGGVLLLVVCANVANLLLARATTRQREFSLRLALGAPRRRLAFQVLTESLLIAILGAGGGLILAMQMSGSLTYLLPRTALPSLVKAPTDTGVLGFTVLLALGVTLLAGIAPALQASRSDVQEALKEGGRTGSSGRSRRLRGLFVISETALAVVALVGAGLFVKSLQKTSEIRPGFDPAHVAVAQLDLSAASFDAPQADAFCQRLREQLERQPGMTAVSYSDYVPLSVSSGSWEDLQVQGYVPSPGENMKLYRSLISPGYFNLLKIPILEGRDFDARDTVDSEPVMIVNREFVRRLIPSGAAIGRKVQGWGEWFTIVAVVENTKVYRLNEPPKPYFYVPIRQIYRPEMGLVFFVRTSGSIDSAISALRREALSAGPTVPVFDASSLDDSIAASLFSARISASLLSVLGSAALLLAAMGLYGVMAYSVAQRTNEIGIRIALGARGGDVLRLVMTEGARLAGIGYLAGAAAALGLTRFFADLLFGVRANDPWIFGGTAALMAAVTLVAVYFPARRAMRVDPIVALRYE